MCNNYRAPKGIDLERGWHVPISGDWRWQDEIRASSPGTPSSSANSYRRMSRSRPTLETHSVLLHTTAFARISLLEVCPLKATPSSGLRRLFGLLSERRVQFPADELPLDILALLVSCGHAVRAEDAQALDEALRSEDTNVATAPSQPQGVIAEAAEHSSPLIVECESEPSPL